MSGWTIGALLDTAAGYLREKGSSSPKLDAELLLASTLGMDRIRLYTEYDRPLSACEVEQYRGLIGRRGRREPVAYILGKAYFRRLVLEVTSAVLIPRPETEELVEVALAVILRRPLWGAKSADEGPTLIADVGCGSGAIALSLAQEAGCRVLATDVSADALTVARRNAESAGLQGMVEFRQGDLLEGIAKGSLRLVVTNPPYVASGDIAGLEPDVRCYEPLGALEAGPEGLDVFQRLLPEAARVLMPGGTLVTEVGDGQAAAVAGLATAAGFALVVTHRDLSGKDRIVEATLPGTDVMEMASLDQDRLDALASALQAGAIVGLPTDTVYGLAAAWHSREGVRRLFEAKGRGETQPVAVVFSSVRAVHTLLQDVGAAALTVMEALLPGPYTFVVTTRVPRPALVGTEDSLGVRVPDHPALLALLERLDVAVAATSANRTGLPAPATLGDVDPGVLGACSVALASRDGATVGGIASTVVDLRPLDEGKAPKVLREGAASARDVLARIEALP